MSFLLEVSQELTRFDYRLQGMFRCPACFRDFPISGNEITEEHIIPDAVGGKLTTFLCKRCNSVFGQKQTRWLGDWIELSEGGAPFHKNPKKQRAKLLADGKTINGSLKIADSGAIEFLSDRKRSNPKDFDAHWLGPKPSHITIEHSMPVFRNETSLRVGYLTAAYCLWFKNFGYSFVLQSSLNIVRQQIMSPDQDVMPWNYMIEASTREIHKPAVGLMRFGPDYFPIALIYDYLVILPSAGKMHPQNTLAGQVSKKSMDFGGELATRFQNRCVGPAVLICDGQIVVGPDLIPNATIPPQYIWVDRWV